MCLSGHPSALLLSWSLGVLGGGNTDGLRIWSKGATIINTGAQGRMLARGQRCLTEVVHSSACSGCSLVAQVELGGNISLAVADSCVEGKRDGARLQSGPRCGS